MTILTSMKDGLVRQSHCDTGLKTILKAWKAKKEIARVRLKERGRLEMAIQGIDAATDPTKKLDITLNNKPANYQLLQQDKLFYMKIGLTKIHRILEFVQSKWLKTYKEFNTKKC